MRIRFTSALVVACGLVLLLGTIAVEAQEPDASDVSGTWALEVTLPSGDIFAGTLTLRQEGGEITGTWQSEGDDESRRVRGKIEGKAIAFSFWIVDLRSRSGGADAGVRMSFEGNLEGDTMTGTASFGSRTTDLDWTAKKID